MSDNKRENNVLKVCLGKTQQLNCLIEYAEDSIVSKTILDKLVGTITLFAFDKGQKLSEHTVPYDAVVQIVDGTAQLMIGGKEITAAVGEIVIMPANIPHSVAAEEKFKMLLTMIRE